ncbi:unnamed protein product [Pleuronectes platessa]|uniref:Uncharacterized protein n=1 Tax=Pleuronectes platessa TaxID=8262 RepID=A0A9N7UBR9_PLEPL|nr:unnamed protein product [Pleuronectes platessa]
MAAALQDDDVLAALSLSACIKLLHATSEEEISGIAEALESHSIRQILRRSMPTASWTHRNTNPNPLLCYCMHAGTAASPQQTSHVQQHGTKRSAPGRTMVRPEDQ